MPRSKCRLASSETAWPKIPVEKLMSRRPRRIKNAFIPRLLFIRCSFSFSASQYTPDACRGVLFEAVRPAPSVSNAQSWNLILVDDTEIRSEEHTSELQSRQYLV